MNTGMHEQRLAEARLCAEAERTARITKARQDALAADMEYALDTLAIEGLSHAQVALVAGVLVSRGWKP